MIIRDLEAADEGAWRVLWAGYLAFYAVDLSPEITDFTWGRLMDPASSLKARVAVEGGIVGFAIHQHHPSSWVMGDDCYLEDLFVAEAARGLGAGRALIADLQSLAAVRGWQRLYWHTDEGNARARALYDSIVLSDGHVRYRLPVKGDFSAKNRA
ncbi:MAG: GNAT family N-acetyltransferase [Paracoccaceae bacterium]